MKRQRVTAMNPARAERVEDEIELTEADLQGIVGGRPKEDDDPIGNG